MGQLLVGRTDTKWKDFGDVWLPVEVQSSSFNPRLNRKDQPTRTTKLIFDWKSVNTEFANGSFDVATFGASKFKPIVDYRTSKVGITVSQVGRCAPDGGPLPIQGKNPDDRLNE